MTDGVKQSNLFTLPPKFPRQLPAISHSGQAAAGRGHLQDRAHWLLCMHRTCDRHQGWYASGRCTMVLQAARSHWRAWLLSAGLSDLNTQGDEGYTGLLQRAYVGRPDCKRHGLCNLLMLEQAPSWPGWQGQ